MGTDNELTSVGDLLKRVIEQNKLEYGIDKVRVKEAWYKIANEGTIRYTEEVMLQGTTLFVSLKSAALREELSYGKTRIIELINEELHKEVVKDIILR